MRDSRNALVAERFVDKYIVSFLRRAVRNGEAAWTELTQQPDAIGVAFETSLFQRMDNGHCVMTLVRRGNVPEAKFQQVEFDLTTSECQKELEDQIQGFMPGKT